MHTCGPVWGKAGASLQHEGQAGDNETLSQNIIPHSTPHHSISYHTQTKNHTKLNLTKIKQQQQKAMFGLLQICIKFYQEFPLLSFKSAG